MNSCPNCLGAIGKHVEAVTGIEHDSSIGDLGICFDCGELMITTEKGLESLEDKSFLSWFERFQLGFMHGEWSWKNGIRGS